MRRLGSRLAPGSMRRSRARAMAIVLATIAVVELLPPAQTFASAFGEPRPTAAETPPAAPVPVLRLAPTPALALSPSPAQRPAPTPTPAATNAVTPAPQPPLRYVYLVRHGHYDRDENADDRVGNGLNAVGREQAVLIGKRLALLPHPVTRLVTSDYTRARETADAVASELNITATRDTLLRECRPHSTREDLMQGRDHDELDACDTTLEAAFAKYFLAPEQREQRDVLVCHGNVIRWFVAKAIGADPRVWGNMDIGNASMTVIAIRPDGSMRLVAFSDTAHLPVDKQTWVGRGPGW